MRQNEKGFTLIELLIALSLLVGIVAVLVNSLRFETRVWERTQQNQIVNSQLSAFQDTLFRWLQQVYPFEDISGDSKIVYPLEGTEAILSFSAPIEVGGFGDGLFRIRLEHDAIAHSLILHAVEDQNGQVDPTLRDRPIAKELLSGVDAIELWYFEGVDSQGRWLKRWQRKTDLPRAIKIKFKGEITKGAWLEVIVQPRVTHQAICIFDPVSRDCRK